MSEFAPVNQETHADYNAEPGIVLTPGSEYQKILLKFEQFPWTRIAQGMQPGNPYVKREFPKMLYKAHHYQGQVRCMAAPPNVGLFLSQTELLRAEEEARRFTESCQRIVQDEREFTRAMEEGWRESPQEAVEFVQARDRAISDAAAHRAYEDRNMSEAAQREIAEAEATIDGHVAEVPVKRRGRPRKSAA